MGIKRVWAMVRRIGKGRGFGIQSPTDYNFVCNVINEPLPYYAYAELKKSYSNLARRQRGKCELLFRIANFMQPQAVVSHDMPKCFETYMSRGCKKATIHYDTNNVSETGRLLMLASCNGIDSQSKESFLQLMKHGNCLVIDDINHNEHTRYVWQSLVADNRCTICFDLYDIGIILADDKRNKVFYAINY